MSFIVAMDGPAGAGKGTITKQVAEKLGLINIDTGAMFRLVTLNVIQEGIEIHEEDRIKEILDKIHIDMKENGEVFLNGEEVSKQIREDEVNCLVSPISVIPIVREKLLELQRKIAQGKNVIMEGRDIGTVVFPNADVKIYLDASAEERARRRLKQNQAEDAIYIDSTNMTIEEVVDKIVKIIKSVQ